MIFSELKNNAKERISRYKGELKKAASIYFIFMVIFKIVTIVLTKTNHTEVSDLINILSDLVLFPILLANIAMVSNIYQEKTQIGAFENFKSWKKFWRSIWTYLLPGLLIFLWTLPLLAAITFYLIKVIVGAITKGSLDHNYFVILVVLAVITTIIQIFKMFQYFLSPYLVCTYEDLSVSESIKLSKKYMKGYKGKLFVFNLTFIGWGLLAVLTLGIFSIWLIPYYNASVYEFYLAMQNEISSKDEIEVK